MNHSEIRKFFQYFRFGFWEYFFQSLVDILPFGSGFVDPHTIADLDPDPGRQYLPDLTDPDPKYWKKHYIFTKYILGNTHQCYCPSCTSRLSVNEILEKHLIICCGPWTIWFSTPRMHQPFSAIILPGQSPTIVSLQNFWNHTRFVQKLPFEL